MKVHVAVGGWAEDGNNAPGFEHPIGVFSTAELAQACLDRYAKTVKYDYASVVEYEVDEGP